MIVVNVNDLVSPKLASLARNLDSRSLLAAVGKRAEKELRAHFQARNNEPNKRGWPKRNFWARVKRATVLASVSDREAVVNIAEPALAQKIHGGVIRPKRGRALAIPATAEAYAAGSPREGFGDKLEFMPLQGPGAFGALVEKEGASSSIRITGKAGKKSVQWTASNLGNVIQYLLVKSVDQKPDKRAMPDPEKFRAALAEEANAWAVRAQGKVG